MHHVVILINEVAARTLHSDISTVCVLVAVAEQVELLDAISRERVRKHNSVILALLHGIDVSVHIELNLKLVHLRLALNSRDLLKHFAVLIDL